MLYWFGGIGTASTQRAQDREQRFLDELEAFVSEGDRSQRKRVAHARRAIVSMLLAGAFVLSAFVLAAPRAQAPPATIAELRCDLPADFDGAAYWAWRHFRGTVDDPIFMVCQGSDPVTADPQRPFDADGVVIVLSIWNNTDQHMKSLYWIHTLDSDADLHYAAVLTWGNATVRLEMRAPAPSPFVYE